MKKIIILIGLFLLITQCFAVTITEVKTNPKKIWLSTKFSINAEIAGDTCGTEARFYIDNSLESSKVIGCGRINAESKTIEPTKYNLECGKHNLRVELLDHGTSVINVSEEFQIGNLPNITIISNLSDKGVILYFLDGETKEPIDNMRVDIYNTRKGIDKAEIINTESDGTIIFAPKEYGEYKYLIEDGDYCGTGSFYAKKELRIDGPYPENPMAGELISLAVPTGVGIKILDSGGELYTTGILTNLGGGVNLTVYEPGNYTLSIGDINSFYWSRNISITVSGKENTSIFVTPEKALRGDEISIEVWSLGVKLNNSKVVIQDPVQQSREYKTNENGTLLFKIDLAGKYKIRFEDEKHVASEKTFDARNVFTLDKAPKEMRLDQDISIYARDQLGNLVSGATISVEDSTYGLTSAEGKYTFKVSAPGKYEVTATKEDFWNATTEIYVISPLRIQLKNDEIEYGTPINPKVFDSQNQEVDAKILIIKPFGAETEARGPFVSDEVGLHEIIAEAKNYISANRTFTVKPMQLELSLALVKDKIYINTTSSDIPAAGIVILVEKADGREKLITDSSGSAVLKIENGGRIKISANPQNENPRYGKITVVRNIGKQYGKQYDILIIGLSIIAFIAVIGVALVYLTPKKEEPRKFLKPYFRSERNKSPGKSRISR